MGGWLVGWMDGWTEAREVHGEGTVDGGLPVVLGAQCPGTDLAKRGHH